MSIVAVSAPKGAAGATTVATAVAMAWPSVEGRSRYLVEADPDGGVLAARLGARLAVSLADVASEGRRGMTEAVLARASTELGPDGVRLVACPASAEEAVTVLNRVADPLAGFLAAAPDLDALVDVGRLAPGSPSLQFARRALVTVIVTRPDFAMAAVLQPRVRALRSAGCEPVLLSIGSRPESPAELAAVVDVPLLGVLPDDAKAAGAAGAGSVQGRAMRRSMWWRQIRAVTGDLLGLAADEAQRRHDRVAAGRPAGRTADPTAAPTPRRGGRDGAPAPRPEGGDATASGPGFPEGRAAEQPA